MPRLTKIYTRKGDDGTTALGGGQRVPKNSPRVTAYGAVDELNSALGLALAHGLDVELKRMLAVIQNELFHLGSDLCFVEEDKTRYALPQIDAKHIERLEGWIDQLNDVVGPLQNFILPGGTPGAAQLHLARTICRRAERDVTTLQHVESIGAHVNGYLNRLSDLLFVMARYENHVAGSAETLWDSRV